ncbi:MAG TPA: cupin domain-containing protein [Halobacteriales archaeon]|nr:cupin domain-containing protein [Halobacteriales archaeon]
MASTGYGTVDLDDVEWTEGESGTQHATLTDRLGCSDTHVDAYRTDAGVSVTLPAAREHLCVSVDSAGTLTADRAHGIEPGCLALVPAGAGGEIESDDRATWLVVSAPAEPGPDAEPVVVDVADLDFRVPATSDILTARLTDRLGCRGMKVNVRRLRSGDVVPYHTEGTQEELFVPLDGNGTVRVDGESHDVPRGSVTRVAPERPRSAVNPGETDADWLMVGAPPTGAADEWDPGAEIHEWPGSG